MLTLITYTIQPTLVAITYAWVRSVTTCISPAPGSPISTGNTPPWTNCRNPWRNPSLRSWSYFRGGGHHKPKSGCQIYPNW